MIRTICLNLFGSFCSFGKFGEDEAVEGGRGLRGALGGGAEMEGGKRIGKGTLALLAEVAVQLGLVSAGGCVGFEAGLPVGELGRVGIDSLDLLREVFESGSGLVLLVGGLAFVGVLDYIRLLYAVTDTIDDLVAALQCAVDVGDGG